MSSDNKTLILVGLAVGALYIMSKQRTVANTGAYRGNTAGQTLGGINLGGAANLVNALGNLFKGGSGGIGQANQSPAQVAAAAVAAQRDEDPNLNGTVADYPSTDGISVNPPNTSVYDYISQP